MEQFKYVAAIDIGTTKIVAIIGRKDITGKVEIVGMGKTPSKGVKRGVVQNIEETSETIKTAVKIAEQQAGVKIKTAYVGIAGQHIKSMKNRAYKFISNPEEEINLADVLELNEDMKKIPMQAGEQIIHVLPQNYIVDDESGIINPVGMSGRKLEANFHIVICQSGSAKNILKCVDRAGIEVNSLILEPLASADAVLTEDEKEVGIAMVDIGGGTTDIAVYYNGIIRHTAVVPFGGNVITSDIKEGCGILARQAEQLKLQFGSALGDLAPDSRIVAVPGINGRDAKEISMRTLAHIIQARMEEIIDAVMFEIMNSGYADRLGAGIAVTGGGSMLRNLSQLMKFRTGLDVKVGFPRAKFTRGLDVEGGQPMFSTGVGLILKGFEFEMAPKVKEKAAPKVEEKKTEPIKEEQITPTVEGNSEDYTQEKNSALNELISGFTSSFKTMFGDKPDPKM
ncbi:MAG TPA: cell division protein FtsA [Bacteroidales bacterium]|nr:cell division protein FtsA [Bacteroidales bacterium]